MYGKISISAVKLSKKNILLLLNITKYIFFIGKQLLNYILLVIGTNFTIQTFISLLKRNYLYICS